AASIAAGIYFAIHKLLPGPFPTLQVERDLKARLQADGLLAKMISTSRQTIAGGKLDPAVIRKLQNKHPLFETTERVKVDELDCIEFWFGGADQHWGLIITKPGTKPRHWRYLNAWETNVWFFSEIPPK